ncbi:DUF2771 family protein [Tsukamurella pseudospumae]|uniref:DUF2771 domain-containing protein n=1 Tax=Tsukamurella pseudospumae TaxID=239498 RepID=A0A137ZZN3_9ACTN|nr:DUF2771 family protein [Tsukamurella pseudospumae]KXP03627.1 hypothetical protein AXK60_17640 [Tsukamurella pseudospumae]
MIKPSRNVLIAGVVFIVAAAVLFAFTISAALDKRAEPRPRPALHATVGETKVDVGPMLYCTDVRTQQCDRVVGAIRMPMTAGQAIVISLPDYITERPWDMRIERFDTRIGDWKVEQVTHVKPTAATLVLKSTEELRLATVTISVPSSVEDSSGNLLAQASWGINTLPDDVATKLAPSQ